MGHLLDDSLSNSHRKTGYTCKKGEEIYITNKKSKQLKESQTLKIKVVNQETPH